MVRLKRRARLSTLKLQLELVSGVASGMDVFHLEFDIDGLAHPELHDTLAVLSDSSSRGERIRQLAMTGLIWERLRLQPDGVWSQGCSWGRRRQPNGWRLSRALYPRRPTRPAFRCCETSYLTLRWTAIPEATSLQRPNRCRLRTTLNTRPLRPQAGLRPAQLPWCTCREPVRG